jgi:hypothetical protein
MRETTQGNRGHSRASVPAQSVMRQVSIVPTVSITRGVAGEAGVTSSEARLAASKIGVAWSMERDVAHIAVLI